MAIDYDKALAKATAKRAAAKAASGRARAALAKARQRAKGAAAALAIAQQLAQGVQAAAHKQVALVVGRCLTAIFDEPYEFEIIFERKRGKTEAKLVFIRDGNEVDPMDAAGGGVIDVASFALRLAAMMLTRPGVRKLLILDEPFKFLSEGYRPRVRGMLAGITREFGVQVVMVTHLKELVTGTVIEVESGQSEEQVQPHSKEPR